MNLTDKKILLTGGAGFIGLHIAQRLLALGAEVCILDNLSSGSKEKVEQLVAKYATCKFVVADICDVATCLLLTRNMDIVIHHAAIASVQKGETQPDVLNRVNVVGTYNVFYAATHNNVAKVIYASSAAVYGDSTTLLKSEVQVPTPSSLYGLSKFINEQQANLLATKSATQFIGLRYFNVYGPGQNPSSDYSGVISIFIHNASQEAPITIFGDGNATRDFIYIDDIVDANLKAIDYNQQGAAQFNIASGKCNTIQELAKQIVMHYKQVSVKFEAARIGDILHSQADCTLATTKLQFSANTNLAEGLNKLMSSY